MRMGASRSRQLAHRKSDAQTILSDMEDSEETQPSSTTDSLPDSNSHTPRAGLPPDLANLTDEQIAFLTQEITDSFVKDVALVGPFLPISVLVEEFKNNEPFRRKLSGLAEKWSGFRRTARNGNCFYQAFMYAWLANLQRLGDKRIKDEIIKVQKTAEILELAGTSLSQRKLICRF